MFSLLSSLAPLAIGLLSGGNRNQNQGYADGGMAEGGYNEGQTPYVQPMTTNALAPYAGGGYADGGFMDGGYASGGHVMQGSYGPQMYAHGGHHYPNGGYVPHYGWGGLGSFLSNAWNSVKGVAKPMLSQAAAKYGPQIINKGAELGQNMLKKGAERAGEGIGNWVGSKFGDEMGQKARSGITGTANSLGESAIRQGSQYATNTLNRYAPQQGMPAPTFAANGGEMSILPHYGYAGGGSAHEELMRIAMRHPMYS